MVFRLLLSPNQKIRSYLERYTLKGESPVEEFWKDLKHVLEYCSLDTEQESGGYQPLTLNMFQDR